MSINAERFFTNKYGIMLAATAATFLWGSAFPFVKLSYAALDIAQNEISEQILFAGIVFYWHP